MEKLDLLQKTTLESEEDRDYHIKDCYVKIKDLNMEQYGETDKRTLKALRNLVILLTRKKQVDEALQNLEIVEKVEAKSLGPKSKQIAKTYSLKATLYLRNGDRKKAKTYFTKAEEIFKELGDDVEAKKVKEKMAAMNKEN
jgi:tetratricopeptide (TPR) repeat protein